jgi:hypothetical protein
LKDTTTKKINSEYDDTINIVSSHAADNPDAMPAFNDILHSLEHSPSTCTGYVTLSSNREWFDRFVDFFTGRKTLPLLYDPFFKMIFNPVESRARLSELVSCILGQHVTVIEVFPHTNYTFPNSFVIMDMVVRLDNGSITNIEIQKVPYDFPAERISCYSADLVLRQFRMLKGMETENTDHGSSSYGKPSYSGMKKVHTIIFFEKSSSSLKSPVNKKAYFHVGKTTFNTGINISLLQEYHLISLDTFKKYRYSDIMDGRIDIDSTDCDDSQYNSGLTEKMKLDRLKYLSLFTAATPSEINRLVTLFPELSSIRSQIREYLTRPGEVLNMFSEALRILDRNTAELMADRYKSQLKDVQKELEAAKLENKAAKQETATAKLETATIKAQADARIAELEAQLNQLKKQQ